MDLLQAARFLLDRGPQCARFNTIRTTTSIWESPSHLGHSTQKAPETRSHWMTLHLCWSPANTSRNTLTTVRAILRSEHLVYLGRPSFHGKQAVSFHRCGRNSIKRLVKKAVPLWPIYKGIWEAGRPENLTRLFHKKHHRQILVDTQ